MEIKRNEKTAVNTVELEIAVLGADFESAIQQAYRKDVSKINVPGFRRGKAPRKIIEQLYGKAVFYEEAVNSATPGAYEAAVKDAALEPVAQPELEIVSIDDNGFVFKAVVTTKPVATVGDYQSIRVERKVEEVADADVDAAVERLAQRNARIETVERPAENGDTAVIDYEGLLDGTPFEGGTAEDYELKLGSGTFIPGFEEQVVGHSAGEQFDVNVTFPEDYHAEELKGKAVVFKVRLHEVKKSILPALDDEFAKDVSEFDTLAALRDDERAKLVKTRENNADQAFESAIMEKLSEITEVEIPDAMIESRIDNIAEDFAYRFQMQGISMDQYFKMTGSNLEDFRASFKDRAAMQVKVSLALEAIAKAENITVTPEEIEAEYVKLAGENGKVEQVKSYLAADALAHDMIAERAMNLLKEIAAREPIAGEAPAEGENA